MKANLELPQNRTLLSDEQVSLKEVEHLNSQWQRREKLVAARHPVPLAEIYSADAKHEADALLATEKAKSWEDLSKREDYNKDRQAEIEAGQNTTADSASKLAWFIHRWSKPVARNCKPFCP